jgi:hypothetical protein
MKLLLIVHNIVKSTNTLCHFLDQIIWHNLLLVMIPLAAESKSGPPMRLFEFMQVQFVNYMMHGFSGQKNLNLSKVLKKFCNLERLQLVCMSQFAPPFHVPKFQCQTDFLDLATWMQPTDPQTCSQQSFLYSEIRCYRLEFHQILRSIISMNWIQKTSKFRRFYWSPKTTLAQ